MERPWFTRMSGHFFVQKLSRFFKRLGPYALGPLFVLALVLGSFRSAESAPQINGTLQHLLSLSPMNIDDAVAVLRQIPDPVERGFAAEQWVRQNRGQTDISRAAAVCNQLPKDEARSCVRHLSAAHLRR